MRSLTQFGKSVLFSVSVSIPVLMAGMAQMVGAAEPIYYQGTAALCAVSPNMFDLPKTKGNNGVSYMDDLVMVYQIKSPETPLMNGSEVMHAVWTQTKSGVTFQTGQLVMTPNMYVDTGAFEEKFKFKLEEGAAISGIYRGTGELKGVTATYELSEMPYVCDPDFNSSVLCPDCVPFPFPMGYDMEGWIEGYETD